MTATENRYDFAIVGAGMAGMSLAAAIGGSGRTVVLEAEEQAGYHATGRSAAFWTESYGGPGVQPLTTASGPFLRSGGFLTPRGALTVAETHREGELQDFAEALGAMGIRAEPMDRDALAARVPGLLNGWTCGVLEPSCCDIDVAALHQHYLSQARQAGAEIRNHARVEQVLRDGQGWRLQLANGDEIICEVLVNAAGAWADEIAGLAGVRPLGIVPMRRTITQLKLSHEVPGDLPLVLDLDGRFYFKPESGRLWLSPHDETPSPPCDAAPEEIDVATAIARLEGVVGWKVERVERSWAGLRSFAPDRLPVYGFDPRVPGFFWCAGQGGFGIQTAPTTADLAASLLLGRQAEQIDPEPYLPGRF